MKPNARSVKFLPILALALWLVPGASGAACSYPVVAGSNAELSVNGRIDAALLDRAILAAVNHQRCRNGIVALQPLTALRAPAQHHSNWMARRQTLSHTSSVSGRRTLKDRVSSTGLPARAASENLAQLALFDLTSRFRVIDQRTCRFASPDGRKIRPHSYRSFADRVVRLWMESPGHRRNLLSRKTTHMAAAATLRPGNRQCGTLYVTQMLLG